MIYDTTAHIDAYRGIHPRVMRALELLRETDFAGQPDGTYEVDGKNLYYFLQTYDTKPENPTPEAHQHYADVMMMLTGCEDIDVAPLETLEDTGLRPEGDIRFYRGQTTRIPLRNDRFVVFFPGDAHAPGITPAGASAQCRKCVLKVCLD